MKPAVKPGQIWEEQKARLDGHWCFNGLPAEPVYLCCKGKVVDVERLDGAKQSRVCLKLDMGTTMFKTIAETTLRRYWKLVQDVKL
jgi:hypothetical protein